MGPQLALIGLGLAAVAVLFLIWRYTQVRLVLEQGLEIRGKVEDLEAIAISTSNDSHITSQRTYRHVHYMTVRYEVHGVEQEVRLKLPSSGFTYGLTKGGPVDLLVLSSKPRRPLVRAVYTPRR